MMHTIFQLLCCTTAMALHANLQVQGLSQCMDDINCTMSTLHCIQ